MNTGFVLEHLNSGRYEALTKSQGFHLIRSYKIVRRRNCVKI